MTVAEVAELLLVDRESARGLVRFLVDVGLAADRGVRKPPRGRGSSERVYSFSGDLPEVAAHRVAALRGR